MNAWLAIASLVCACVLQNNDSPSAAREHYKRAATALLSKNLAVASTELQQIVEKFPDDPLAPLAALRLAECQLAQGNPKSAIVLLEPWIDKLAESPKTLAMEPALLLRSHLVLARAHLAADNLQQALDIGNQQRDLYAQLSNITSLDRHLLEQLRAVVDRASKGIEQSQAVYLRSAADAVRRKSYSEGLHALKKCDPQRLSSAWLWRYRVLKAQCLQGNGDATASIVELDKIDTNTLSDAEKIAVRMATLESAMAAGQNKRAQVEVVELEKATQGDSQLAPTVALRAVELATLNKNREVARQKAQAAKLAYPNFPSLFEFDLLLARNAIADVEFTEARQILQSVIEAAPSSDSTAVPRAHWLLGESYFLSRDYAAAIAAYTAVIQSGCSLPIAETALVQRGKCYELQGDYVAAAADYRRLLSDFGKSKLCSTAQERLAEIDSTARSAASDSTLLKR